MATRRLIQQLPVFNQTVDLTDFFGATVDEVFQPGTSQPISGYIGTVSSTDNAQDIYVGEPTASRAAYQLEPGMVSYDTNDNLIDVLSYPDFISYIQTSGGIVSNQQRLTETDFYSWAPPINIDMLVNYSNYYWFGDALGSADLPILVLTIPVTMAVGNGTTTTFDLPASILAVARSAETPAVYVNNLAVSFKVIGNTVVLVSAPPVNSVVLVARVPNFAEAVLGQTTVTVSDINSNGVVNLSSGMRIRIIDLWHIIGAWDMRPWAYVSPWDPILGLTAAGFAGKLFDGSSPVPNVPDDPANQDGWDFAGSGIYMVDGIGLSLRLTDDDTILRGLVAQYVTIDRSSLDHNLWSLHNSWVHKDTFAWYTGSFQESLSLRRAQRPIIEYIRDLQLWLVEAQLTTTAVGGATSLALLQTLPNITGSGVSGGTIAPNTSITNVIGNSIILSAPITANMPPNTTLTCYQVWSESTDPLFMLYDVNDVPLNAIGTTTNPGIYAGSNFLGNSIFDYSVGSTPTDPALLRSLAFDANGYILFDDRTTIDSRPGYTLPYTCNTGPIEGLYAYGVNDGSLTVQSLWHLTAGTTSQGVTNGFYNIPLNLQANPSSEDVTTISQSTWVGQFSSLIANQLAFDGQAVGDNNYRDTARDLGLGTVVLQHRAPLLKTMLLASNSTYDLLQSIRYADQEYTRFKNKFARMLTTLYNKGTLSDADPATTWVTTTLAAVSLAKNTQFPFALNTIAGGNYFIPPTPTCLGIMPAAVPAIITDDTTFNAPQQMLLGHDGSLTLTFGDWRDPIMLALEQTIYTNLPPQFQTEARPMFDIQHWIGGRWYAPYNGYSRAEVATIMVPFFELWAQNNQFDYRLHPTYDPNNPFSWNFSQTLDIFGNALPGNWRAIYRWYYGTDAPHLRPWEMLGFVSEPTWWQTTYGAPPYAKSNTVMWTDLQHGRIAGGPRVGTDPTYARPGLTTLLPVDNAGNLLDPVATGIVTSTVIAAWASAPWQAGDQGPIENLWINSSSYRYALAMLSFLAKPARFVEECWNLLGIGYIGTQWVDFSTLNRPLNSDQYVHGEINNGVTVEVIGISQWIADFMLSSSIASSAFGTAVRGLDVRLLHQMAGFTSSDEMQVSADNFGLVPTEDVGIALYTSPTLATQVYSGVILTWTGQGWQAIGYDARNPTFTVIPPNTTGPKGIISIATAAEPTIVPWRPNTYYATGVLVNYLNSVYQCLRSHTSGPQFEQNYWQAQPNINPAMVFSPRVITYSLGLSTTQIVPYGTVFTTYQAVADFLLGWERWLVSNGWSFTSTDPTTGLLRNWSLSVTEFLNWAQVQWAPGNFIALSPGQQQLTFTAVSGMILNVEDNTTGFFGLLDRSGNPINQTNAIINRLDGHISISANNADVFCARLALADVEHALVFSNTTIFDDVIYLPLYDLRQPRLLLNCQRSRHWAGRMNAPGFVIIGNTLASDFTKAAEDIRLMFDIEAPDRTVLREYARHVIGFQVRDYMENLFLSDIEMFEFYQGMIQQKGTPGVFNKLVRSNRASNDSNLQFLEEWAIRIDEFGAPVDPFLTVQLTQVDMRDDPQIVRLIPTPLAPPDWIVLSPIDSLWVDQPADPATFFTMRGLVAPSLPSAGPVRLSDVLYTVFSISAVPTLYLPAFQAGLVAFPTGSSTWVYQGNNGTYTVLRSFETGHVANAIRQVRTNNEDPTIPPDLMQIVFQLPITMTTEDIGDYLVVDGLSQATPEIQGVVTITAVDTTMNAVYIDVSGTSGSDFTTNPTAAPFVRILREVRFPTRQAALTAPYAFAPGDLVWVDDNTEVLTGVAATGYVGVIGVRVNHAVGMVTGGVGATGQAGILPVSLSPPVETVSTAPWAVLQWNGKSWDILRCQPPRTAPNTISETVIYSQGAQIVGQQMIIDEPVVDDLLVIDPMAGLIAGIAAREIDFKVGYDPAGYSAGVASPAVRPWGATQVGRVWWNLATVAFLDPFTDTLGLGTARDIMELSYRVNNWSTVAPGASVDVYEWTQSTTPPNIYTGPGTVYNSTDPAWATQIMFDTQTGLETTLYYFWVSGLTVTPSVPFRRTPISTVALAITNPSALDLAWLAPISTDAMIVSGVSQFLNDTATVLKVRQTLNPENPGRHNEWQLMRPTDGTSLPSAYVWQKLRDSLAGFNTMLQPIPDPSLSSTRNTGIRPLQSMFTVPGSGSSNGGLLAARQAFVGIVNSILDAAPMLVDRLTDISTLYRSTMRSANGIVIDQYLAWAQPDDSYIVEPPPYNEWDVQVFSLDERNRLLGREDFIQAAIASTNIRVLVNGVNNPLSQWSIWQFNGAIAHSVISAASAYGAGVYGSGPYGTSYVFTQMLANATTIFTLATAYDQVVPDRPTLYTLSGNVTSGTRVFVTSDTDGFWAIWIYLPDDPAADLYGPYGFVLWRVQSYRTDDFIETIDWYAAGYAATSPPTVSFANVSARNTVEGASPVSQFVLVQDDGTSQHRWIWTQWDASIAQWTTVAMQNGTVALSDVLYTAGYDQHDVIVWQLLAVAANPGDTSLTLVNSTGWQLGQFVMGPGIPHTTKVAVITGTIIVLDTPITQALDIGIMLGVTALSMTDITSRDGSWELAVLADALCYGGLLLDTEINQTFFGMLDFVHSQQDDVDWAFKTSFMNVVGYGVPLEQTPVMVADQTPSLVSFIDEVKPYHVKIRELSTQYNTDVDLGNAAVTDADAFAITLLFDRYDLGDAWDIYPWSINPWDDEDDDLNHIYVHTTILAITENTVQVDDIRFLTIDDMNFQYNGATVTSRDLLTINIGNKTYQITSVTPDAVNQSTTMYGLSGVLGATTTITGTVGELVEAVIVIPNAALRTVLYYTGTDSIVDILGTDYQPVFALYTVSTNANSGDTSLWLTSTTSIALGQPVTGPNIPGGTTVTGVTGLLLMLSQPLLQNLTAGAVIAVGLPIEVSGTGLTPTVVNYEYEGVTPPTSGWNPVLGTAGSGGASGLFSGAASLPPVPPVLPYSLSINPPLTSQPGGFDLRAPYRNPNHPQERIPFNADDALHLLVTALPEAGGPPQIVKTFAVTDNPVTLFFGMMAQSAAGVMVFRDGVRAVLDVDYTVDQFACTVTVNLSNSPQAILIHAFGFGGTSAITDAFFLSFDGNPLRITDSTVGSDVVVTVAGTPTVDFTVSDTAITLASPPSVGTDVAIVLYDAGATTATQITSQSITYVSASSFTISNPDLQTVPEHAGTIVEVNGQRLTPPATFYGSLTANVQWMLLSLDPSTATTVALYVNGGLYSDTIPVATGSNMSSSYPLHLEVPSGTGISTQFAFYGNYFISLNPNFVGTVALVLEYTSLPADYTVNDATLTINKALQSGDQIVITTFRNASSMGIETGVVYPSSSPYNTAYYAAPWPVTPNYALVTLDGLLLTAGVDYSIDMVEVTGPSLDSESLDNLLLPMITMFDALDGDVVVTAFTATPATEFRQWMNNSRVPAAVRMPPLLNLQGQPITGEPSHPHIPTGVSGVGFAGALRSGAASATPAVVAFDLYNLIEEHLHVSPLNAGTLAADLQSTDDQFTINLFLRTVSPKLLPAEPFTVPTTTTPGAVWIGGERIEYFGYSRSGSSVTLSGLRRATRGTSILGQQLTQTDVGTGSPLTFTFPATGAVAVVVDGVSITTYSTTVTDGSTSVTVTANGFIGVVLTVGYVYNGGSIVYNGDLRYNIAVPIA